MFTSLSYWGVQNWTQHPRWISPVVSRWDHLHWAQFSMPVALFATKAHCWIMFHLLSIRTSGPFLQSCFSRQSIPNTYLLLCPKCRTSSKAPITAFLQPIHLWIAACPSVLSTTCSSFVYKLVECAFCLIIQVTNEDVKQYCPEYQPLGFTTSDWPPTGLHAADHNTLSPAVQPVFSLP